MLTPKLCNINTHNLLVQRQPSAWRQIQSYFTHQIHFRHQPNVQHNVDIMNESTSVTESIQKITILVPSCDNYRHETSSSHIKIVQYHFNPYLCTFLWISLIICLHSILPISFQERSTSMTSWIMLKTKISAQYTTTHSRTVPFYKSTA